MDFEALALALSSFKRHPFARCWKIERGPYYHVLIWHRKFATLTPEGSLQGLHLRNGSYCAEANDWETNKRQF